MDKFVIRSKKNSSDFQSVPAVTVSPCSNSEEIVDVHEDFNEPVPSGLTDQVSDSLSDVIPLSQSHCACARAVAEASASKSKQKPYGRRFIPKWTETFSWIEYRLPLPRESREKDAFQAFVEKGFDRWKDAIERFKIHERSALHLAAVSGLLDAEKTPISATFSNILKRDMEDNRSALKRIFSVYDTCACKA
ncbi:hypothetical protein OUZ56_025982 [Daphnia magna]|uniref:Uncharacterized protein n=1 Tax=Daphnia magna TaxID=35525 RepID=A0ABQ9ZKI0_9CRUS|nr:hypothetical protein OUZ56_025982 [Daphnia magna]